MLEQAWKISIGRMPGNRKSIKNDWSAASQIAVLPN
jgi:hypothetical protein